MRVSCSERLLHLLLERFRLQVSVLQGSLHAGVPQDLFEPVEIPAAHDEPAGKGVPQTVEMQVLRQFRLASVETEAFG